MAALDYDVIKDIPGYKVILKAVLKSQIQQLVEQLASATDEESVILTASVSDGTLSHLGSESGKGFLEDHEDIKSQFLGFCLRDHKKRKEAEKERSFAEMCQQSMQTSPGRYGAPPSPYTAQSPRLPSYRGRGSVHPVRMHKATPGSLIRSPGVRHEPYTVSRSPSRTSLNLDSGRNLPSVLVPSTVRGDDDLDGQVIKLEPGRDNEVVNQSESDAMNYSTPESLNLPNLEQLNYQTGKGSQSGEKDGGAKIESSNINISNESLADRPGLSLDSDLSNMTPEPSGESGEIDPDVSVKMEALAENETELEITGVEPGRPVVPQDNWDPNVSMGMNFDPSQGAVGNQGDVTGQGYIQASSDGSLFCRPKAGVVLPDLAKENGMIEMYPQSGVYWYIGQKESVLVNSQNPEAAMGRMIDVFFNRSIQRLSSARGSGKYQPLCPVILDACLRFVQNLYEVDEASLIKVINNKCSHSRRPPRIGCYSREKYLEQKNKRKTMNQKETEKKKRKS